jgi:hypothetical protein
LILMIGVERKFFNIECDIELDSDQRIESVRRIWIQEVNKPSEHDFITDDDYLFQTIKNLIVENLKFCDKFKEECAEALRLSIKNKDGVL